VVEASLGYFINPLVTILLGVVLLKERLRPGQWAAVGTGLAAVVVISVGYGQLPWISLVLAFSFGTYGLLKKKVRLGGLESLAAETTVLFLPALGFLLWLGATGASTFTTHGPGHAAWLASAGLVTAVPLVLFGASAVRLPLTTLGLLQYLTPVIQLALGVAYFHEPMPPERWAGFALVWVALIVLTWDALRSARRTGARAARLRATPPRTVGAAPSQVTRRAPAPAASTDSPGGQAVAGTKDTLPGS
jgi:chloramphenicol-sensitive protein RarD